MRLYIAGHTGLVGSAFVRRFSGRADVEVLTATRSQLDLTNQEAVHQWLKEHKPDVVVVAARPPWKTLLHVPRLFSGQIARVPDVAMRAASDIQVTSAGPVVYHLDGEPYVGGARLDARPRPGALKVAIPADAQPDLVDRIN